MIQKDAKLYYVERWLAYYTKGELDLAIKDFNKAIELNPEYPYAYYNRGIAYADKGNTDQAIGDFSKAIELNSKYAIHIMLAA